MSFKDSLKKAILNVAGKAGVCLDGEHCPDVGVGGDVSRIVSRMDFWSDNVPTVNITGAATNINLPNIVVANLPVGITIIRVVALLKIALIKDTSGVDNAVNNAAMVVAIDATLGYPSTVIGINVPDDSWAVDVSEATERDGDALLGNNNILAEVMGNGTYYARLENAQADGVNLVLKDVAVGLRVIFTS